MGEFDINEFVRPMDSYFKKWIDDLKKELKEQTENLENFLGIIYNIDRIFVCGEGRSGLVSLYNGMRLKHAGYEVQEVGHCLTSPMGKEGKKEVLLCVSGSGETESVIRAAKKAKENFVHVIGITSFPDSSLAKLCDEKIIISGRTKNRLDGIVKPISYLGSEFEYKSLCFMEIVVNYLAEKKGITEKEMSERHANVE